MNTITFCLSVLIAAAPAFADVAISAKDERIANGKKIVEQKRCSICHAVDGKGGKLGKPMNGLTTGKTDEFLRESILDPKKAIDPKTKMPAYKFTDDEVNAVIQYMKSLKPAGEKKQ